MLDCHSNRIIQLPALPISLTLIMCIHNPFSRASFTILRRRFPQMVLNPIDYYPESVVPETESENESNDESNDESDEYSDHELTPGDRIELRNVAIQNEVHKEFDKLDLSKLYPVIGSESPEYNPEKLFDFIRELVYTNTLDEEERAKIITLFVQFTENIRDTLICYSDFETQQLLSNVLTYVGRQNQEFKNNYIRFFIGDIIAYEYNPEIPDLPIASCPKGIKERIVMSLKSATLGQTEAYQELLHAFTNQIPIDVIRQFASDCYNDPRVQELFEQEDMTIDRKVNILADCIRERLQGTEYFPQSGRAEVIPDPPELSDYIRKDLPHVFEGGRKTKRKLKKRKTRKLKKRKTKRKIKKSKLSKRFK
jgi:hypothetical protein